MHPFEALFVKSTWHMGEPFTSKYASWSKAHALGHTVADGDQFDDRMLHASIQVVATYEGRDFEGFYRRKEVTDLGY